MDPAQTMTIECTGDFGPPVLAGSDLVAFFSLKDGAPPVSGAISFMSEFEGYRFYFSSAGDLAAV